MDGHRGYANESESPWYGGDSAYAGDSEWDNRYSGDSGFRVPASRHGASGGTGGGSGGPRSGQPIPPREPDPLRDPLPTLGSTPPLGGTPPPVEESARHHTEAIDRSALRRPPAPAPVGDGLYRTRRPALAVPITIVAVALALPTGRVLLASAFGPQIVPAGVIASSLFLAALPLLSGGLYGLMTGAARVPDAPGVRAWLRPPLAYLAVGLVCALGAAIAVG